MHRDGIPAPSPSKAPQQITETQEKINPRLMIRRAFVPMAIVSGVDVKICMSIPGAIQQSKSPASMIAEASASAV